MPYVSQVASGRRPKLSVFGCDYDTPDGTGSPLIILFLFFQVVFLIWVFFSIRSGVRDYIHIMDLAEGHWAAAQTILATAGSNSRGTVLEVYFIIPDSHPTVSSSLFPF